MALEELFELLVVGVFRLFSFLNVLVLISWSQITPFNIAPSYFSFLVIDRFRWFDIVLGNLVFNEWITTSLFFLNLCACLFSVLLLLFLRQFIPQWCYLFNLFCLLHANSLDILNRLFNKVKIGGDIRWDYLAQVLFIVFLSCLLVLFHAGIGIVDEWLLLLFRKVPPKRSVLHHIYTLTGLLFRA